MNRGVTIAGGSESLKLPLGWRVAKMPDGSTEVTQPPRVALLVGSALAVAITIALWYFGADAVVGAFQGGDYAMAVALSAFLVILNALVSAVIWVTASLRDRWRLAPNLMELRFPGFDGTQTELFSGAAFWIVHRETEEGDGWFLRVQTRARVLDLCVSARPKRPLALGRLIADRTGWPLNLPEELSHVYRFTASGAASSVLKQGPPPGLGFEWHVAEDGSLVMTRRSATARMAVSLLALGVVCSVIGLAIFISDLVRFHEEVDPSLVLFLVLAFACLVGGLRPAFAKERWRVGQGFLEVRGIGLSEGDGVQFTNGSFTMVRLSVKDGERWNLLLIARGGQRSLWVDLTPDSPLLLGEFLAACTGWPLQLPEGLQRLKAMPSAAESQAPGY